MIKNAQSEFNTLGSVAAATFAAIVRETGDVVQAMNAIEPSLAKLAQLQEDLGLKADGAFGKLMEFRKVIKDNEDIANSLSGIASVLRGLGDAGIVTQDLFSELGASVSEMYQKLIDRGVGEQNAMMMSQASLQQLWQMQHDYGFTLDENTQKLVDQAEEQGLVGDKFKDVNQKILDMLIAIGTALGAVIPEYLKVGDAAEDASGRAEGGIERQRKKWKDATDEVLIYRDGVNGIDLGQIQSDIEDATSAQGDLVGAGDNVSSKLDDSVDDFKRWRGEAVAACDDVYDALNAVAVGHSPGGVAGVTSQTQIALDAFHDFSAGAGADLEKVEAALKSLASLEHEAVSAQLEGLQKTTYDLGFQQELAIQNWLKESEGMSQDIINRGIAAINTRFAADLWNARNAEAERQAEVIKTATDALGEIQNQIIESGLSGLQLTLHQITREEQKALEQWMETSRGMSQAMIDEGVAAIGQLYDIRRTEAGGPGQREINGEWLDPLYSDWRAAQGLGYQGSLTGFLSDRQQYVNAMSEVPGQETSSTAGQVPGVITYEDSVPIVIQIDGETLTRIVVKRTGQVLNQYGV
jgi:hypothetical protein